MKKWASDQQITNRRFAGPSNRDTVGGHVISNDLSLGTTILDVPPREAVSRAPQFQAKSEVF
jgi:hypothetical protein